MKKYLLRSKVSLMLVILILLAGSNTSVKLQGGQGAIFEYVPNEVLVKFREGVERVTMKTVIDSLQATIFTSLDEEISTLVWNPSDITLRSFRLDPNLVHIQVPEYIGTEQAIYLLELNPYVEYAEANTILHIQEEPNDDYFYLQWGLHNTGDEEQGGGTADADIYALEAWDVFTGSSDIVVAVIDTGVWLSHEDLYENLWANPGEIAYNGIDDDNNGKIDDYRGWDFVDQDRQPSDWHGHGTHVAGIIGAVTNNDKGIAGVNWRVSIMVLRVGDENAHIKKKHAISAIDYATEMGAHISNNSYGWYEDQISEEKKTAMKEAIERAKNAGSLFVAACGNEETWDIIYPARFNLENIISVLATDHNDNLAPYSNWNSIHVDLGAPGGFGPDYLGQPPNEDDIYSTLRINEYGYKSGTSMAAPHVAGVAALIWGYPVKIWWDQVKEIILDNVDILPSLSGKCLTGGEAQCLQSFHRTSAIRSFQSKCIADRMDTNKLNLARSVK